MSAKLSKRVRLFLNRLSGARAPRRSAAFDAFRANFLGGEPGQPLDIPTLLRLNLSERRLAERLMLDALPERRAVIGLGELGSQRARPRLEQIFAQSRAAFAAASDFSAHDLVACARALWLIAPDPTYAGAVIDVLARARGYDERMDAAAALADMPSAEAEDALNAALEDRDALVRHHAARSLLAMHGLETDPRALAPMISRVMAQDPERRRDGRRELAEAMERREAAGEDFVGEEE